MISFHGRCEQIRNADRFTRLAASVYPHISTSKASEKISRQISYMDYSLPQNRSLSDLSFKYSTKLSHLRLGMSSGIELLKAVIRALKEERIGNCYEEARLTEIIAKINGQENVYPMKILVSRNRSGALVPIDHAVAVITDKKIEPKRTYLFKNNEAVILDPWLGITDFCAHFSEKLKNDFAKHFDMIPDNDFSMRFFAKTSKDMAEFKQNKKDCVFNPEVWFSLHSDGAATKEEIKELRREYPELILK